MEIAISMKIDFHTIYNKDPYYFPSKDFFIIIPVL
jgi:hypothetical protein